MLFNHNTLYFIFLPLVWLFVSCEQDPDEQIIPQSPEIDFEIVIIDSIVPAEVAFINHSKYIDYFEWDFGDGISSTEESPQHMYSKDGTFTVTLKGSSASDEITISKSIAIVELYQYNIINNSSFNLYNLQSFSASSDISSNDIINHGTLSPTDSINTSIINHNKIHISFENEDGLRFKSAFAFELEEDVINTIVIDKYTLVIVDSDSE